MEFGWSDELDAFRQEIRAFAREQYTPAMHKELQEAREGEIGPLRKAFNEELESRGWARQAWPAEYGGSGKNPMYQAILVEELSYAGFQMANLSIGSVAPAIMNFGTEAQKAKYLPGVLKGDITFAIGYSEPNAGTDLASLQTRAVKDGDEWVINGQKIWTSLAHITSHIWLAARTDPDAPKHRGISMLIVPMDSAGLTVRPLYGMGGDHDPPRPGEESTEKMAMGRATNEVFFEDVRVSADALIGEENRGWYIAANALDHERVTIAPLGGLVRPYDDYLNYLKSQRPEQVKNPQVRDRMANLKVELHMQRALKTMNAAIISKGDTPNMEASMTKVWSSELSYRMTDQMMNMTGRYGGLRKRSGDIAPLEGRMEGRYRGSPVSRFGGGTNEVQRNIIAQRGLGLPR